MRHGAPLIQHGASSEALGGMSEHNTSWTAGALPLSGA